MLLHVGFSSKILLLSLLYGNPAAVVLDSPNDRYQSVPVSSYEDLGCSGEKMWCREEGCKTVRSVPLPPKAGQFYRKYIYVSEEKQLGNWPGDWGTWLSEGSPSPWCQGYFCLLTDSWSGSDGETVLIAVSKTQLLPMQAAKGHAHGQTCAGQAVGIARNSRNKSFVQIFVQLAWTWSRETEKWVNVMKKDQSK